MPTAVESAKGAISSMEKAAETSPQLDAFAEGFISFCKESGYDISKDEIVSAVEKSGGLPSEIIGNLTGMIPIVGGLGTLGGMAGAAITDPRTPEEQRAASRGSWRNFIPGVAQYNLWKRMGRTGSDYAETHGKDWSQMVPEYLGMGTSSLLGGGLGGLAGAGIGSLFENAGGGAVAGALAGGVLPPAIGALAALLTKSRTRPEQAAYEADRPTMQNLLVPGLAQYNWLKRMGHSRRYDEEGEAEGARMREQQLAEAEAEETERESKNRAEDADKI